MEKEKQVMPQEIFIKKLLDRGVPQTFGYSLKVVEVTESKVVAKIIGINHPWVKIREGDKITP